MPQEFSHGYALLIGVGDNRVARWSLPGVAKDIRAVAEVLSDPACCGYPRDNICVLDGAEATRQNVLDQLEWLHGRLRQDGSQNATAVIYFSGHGFRDEATTPAEYYLVPYDAKEDGQGLFLRSSGLRATDFADAVRMLAPRRLLVILDCCHAAGMDVKDAEVESSRYVSSAFPVELLTTSEKGVAAHGGSGALEGLGVGHGRAILSSSQAGQKSYMRKDGAMSLFTYHFIEALTGHAEPKAGATEVLVSDVVGHVTRRVKESSVREQRPVPQEPHSLMDGNFPVALLLGGRGLSKGELAPDPLNISAAQPQRPAGGSQATISARDITGATVVAGQNNVVQIGGPGPARKRRRSE